MLDVIKSKSMLGIMILIVLVSYVSALQKVGFQEVKQSEIIMNKL